ncbi:MAG: DUF1294 domain-containing protein [Defluviitaleaceae bacterium]|nr:DUF1294 domain-containing protein [Defluviitaleaceae bacterium]
MRIVTGFIIRFGIIELFLVFFILINLITFLLFVIDKQKAEKGKWRISESVLIFFIITLGGIGALIGMRLARHKTKRVKFKIATIIGLFIALVPVVHIVHGLTLDRVIQYTEVEFYSENWPQELDGYRIAFISDVHTTPHDVMENVATELNKRKIDLLLLGGDFSFRDNHYQGSLKVISQTVTTDGIFGVEGNHDDYRRLFAAKELHGITPLDNDGIQVRNGFYLAGVQDMWNRNPDISTAIAGANANDFILLISHNPDVAMAQSTVGVDLMLAGHTHNGQITLFGVPFYLLRGSITNYGMRFGHAFAESADGIPVFTSRGVGDYYTVPRIFSRPEVVIFTMRSAEQ